VMDLASFVQKVAYTPSAFVHGQTLRIGRPGSEIDGLRIERRRGLGDALAGRCSAKGVTRYRFARRGQDARAVSRDPTPARVLSVGESRIRHVVARTHAL
jgi:hypothetical protein